MDKNNVKYRLSKAMSRLMISQPFFGTLLSSLEINKTQRFHTMATDGSQILFSEEFIDKLTDEELCGVLLHEALHIAYLHCDPQRHVRSQDPMENHIWNVACDLVINAEIGEDLKERLPEGGVKCSQCHGMAVEEVYKSLELKKMGSDSDDDSEELSLLNQPGNKSKKQSNVNLIPGLNMERFEIWFRGEWKARTIREKIAGQCLETLLPMDKSKKDEIVAKLIRSYVMATENGQGNIPGDLARMIEGLRKPKIPWQRVLQRFVGTILAREDYRFFPPNRRYLADDIWIPSLRSEKVGNLAVAIDSSGSISETVLQQFASELAKIVGLTDEVLVIVCDCQIYSVVKIRQIGEIWTKVKMQGGGGTSHIPVFEELAKRKYRPEGLICLTDGFTEYPKNAPNFPVLWCLTPDGGLRPPWGECVVIPGGTI